jgi:hypothetical protein
VEFTPFEIGMPKYGTFMKTELFGSKFFMGRLCTEYEEQPLHLSIYFLTKCYIDENIIVVPYFRFHNLQH